MQTMKEVIIDGVEYVPKTTVIPEKCQKALRELLSLIWIEAHYDPLNSSSEQFARKLYPHIDLLNDVLKFRK